MLEHVLAAYRDGDLDDCIRRVRTLVEAAPLATAPRQLLASLYAETGKGRLALVHYRKLLPLAIASGQVFRSIAIQKQIDALDTSGAPDPQRGGALLAQLRAHGLPHVAAPPADRPWVEAQMLALPRAWFDRVVEETRVQVLGREAEPEEVEAGTVWEVLGGRLRWNFQLPNGRTSAPASATEGNAVHVDPELGPRALVSFQVELPVECLRFDAAFARELGRELAISQPLTGATTGGFTRDERALLPNRPRRREDLDLAPRVPTPAAEGPPRLAPNADSGTADTPRDTGDWIDHGVVSLSDSGASPGRDDDATDVTPGATLDLSSDAARGERPDSGVTPREHTIDLPSAGGKPSRRRGRPMVERPGPQELGEGLIIPPIADPFAAPIADLGKPVERRRHPRVGASFQTRMAMLRLAGTRVVPIQGELFDLSTRGLGVRFAKEHAAAASVLSDAVIAVELDLPGGPLRMAAQVRWLEIDDEGPEARLGIEFVLATEPDRRRIESALEGMPRREDDEAAEAS